MTREETIQILKAIRVYECYPKSASEEAKEAIDMAIEALSAEAEYSKLLQTALNGIPIVDLTDGKTKPSAEIPTESTNTPTNTPTDLISRADAVEAVKKIVPYVIDKDTGQWGILVNKANVITELSALPSADATQGEWIPCSERLPNESGEYLATIPLDADEPYTEVLTFHKGRFYEDDDEWGATYHDDVLAWMPLPTPYKGGDDE